MSRGYKAHKNVRLVITLQMMCGFTHRHTHALIQCLGVLIFQGRLFIVDSNRLQKLVVLLGEGLKCHIRKYNIACFKSQGFVFFLTKKHTFLSQFKMNQDSFSVINSKAFQSVRRRAAVEPQGSHHNQFLIQHQHILTFFH